MHIGSMSLGIFDWLIGWISNMIGIAIGWIVDIVMGIVNRVLFNTAAQVLKIVDYAQILFKRLSGTGDYLYNGAYSQVDGKKSSVLHGDILVSLITDKTVLQVLLALSLVAVLMTIIATIIKVVQSEFTTEGSKNSKGAIIGDALKSFIKFALVPVLCVGGVILSNMLLQLLNQATGSGVNQSMSSQIFVSSAYSANKARNGVLSGDDVARFLVENKILSNANGDKNTAQVAAAIDDMFRKQQMMEGRPPASAGGIVDTILQGVMGQFTNPFILVDNIVAETQSCASYQNIFMVTVFYDIGHINMFILFGGAIVACFIMMKVTWGMVMRLFKAVILFMISPPVIAIAPLDKGNVFSSWRKQFISEVLGAYGAVLGLNLFFIVLPLFNNINLFGFGSSGSVFGWGNATDNVSGIIGNPSAGGYGGNIMDNLLHLLFTLVGLNMVKDLIKMISGIAGGTDALAEGEGMAKKVGKQAATAAKAAATVAVGVVTGGAGAAAMMNAGKFAGMASKLAGGKKAVSALNNKELAMFNRTKGKEMDALAKKAKKATAAGDKVGAKKAYEEQARLQHMSDEDYAKYVQERETKRQTTKLGTAKNMGLDLGAQILGPLSAIAKEYTGLELSTDPTYAGRKKKRTEMAEAAADRIQDGEATVWDYVTKGARGKVQEKRDALKGGVDRTKGDNVENSYNDMAKKVDLSNPEELAQLIAQGIAHQTNTHEGETSQQIWRGMNENLKALRDSQYAAESHKNADGSIDTTTSDYKKWQEMLKKAETMRSGYASQLNDINVQSKVIAEVKAQFATQGPASTDEIKKAIDAAAKKNGVKPEDLNATVDKITQKIMEAISNAAPK